MASPKEPDWNPAASWPPNRGNRVCADLLSIVSVLNDTRLIYETDLMGAVYQRLYFSPANRVFPVDQHG